MLTMDGPSDRSSELLSTVTVETRLNPGKLSPDGVVVADTNLIGAQYMNLHRLPEELTKVQLVTDPLPNELLNSHVVELPTADLVAPPVVGGQYYDDDLLTHDLTEEDKRLAAALVAVQFVQQQKQQHSILASELLGGKTVAPLSPMTSVSVSMDKPSNPNMAAMVTSYIQAFDDDTAQHTLLEQAVDRSKIYQTSITTNTLPDLTLLSLPPLKKVLSGQSLLRRYDRPLTDTPSISLDDAQVGEIKQLTKVGRVDREVDGVLMETEEEGDSEFEGDTELKPCRKSLPHKKRIPRKLKSQPARHNSSKGFKCQKCGESFTTQSAFASHRATHSLPTKRSNAFSCEICSGQFSNQIKFFEHLKSHYEPNLTQTMGVATTTAAQQPQLVDCNTALQVPLVQDTFAVKPELEQLTLQEDLIRCDQCPRTFRRQKAYETHVAMSHPQIEEFSEPEDMMEGIRHVVSIQASAPDEEQDDKLRRWRFSDELNIPTDINLEDVGNKTEVNASDMDGDPDAKGCEKGKKRRSKATQCPHCGRVFTHRNSLLYHIRSHTGRRPHQCDVCGKSFFAANALRVHMRMHSGDKPYKCEFCSRNFRQWGDLKYHMTSIHSSQKQYQCEFCGKDFARKYSLIVHRRIHTGEKNYVCEYCRKTFRASSYLVNHRRIHTGEKPYTCDVCHKAFRVKSDMKRHRNTHNKERMQERISNDVTFVNASEPESILPDNSPTPLNLNMRQDSTDSLTYTRDPLDRDPNTLYVWLPATGDSILSDE